MNRLVVVSNRVPLTRDGAVRGGLAVALLAALQNRSGLWFGWDGKVLTATQRYATRSSHSNVDYATISLSREDYDDYYKGYSNSVLWPLFHLHMNLVDYQQKSADGYERVNALFARKLLPLLQDGDLIWVHDYHCIPLGHYLRQAKVSSPLGFFLHIPFPPYDLFRTLPNPQRLLHSLCSYDLVGFQTDIDRESFLDSVRFGLADAKVRGTTIGFGGHRTRTGVFPISIDVDDVAATAMASRDGVQGRRLSTSVGDRQLVIGLDRLDYSKGLAQRFRAFERLLEEYPANRGRLVFLQIAQPSRNDVPEYQQIRRSLDAVAGEINGRFADYDWVPIRYINKSYARTTVLGFLSLSDIGLVTPMRDGMNLVAKEFVAAQDPDNPGILVLSDFTGAARELGSSIIVNPYNEREVADGLARAVVMPLPERKARWQESMQVLRSNDIHRWRRRFVGALERAQ